MTATNANTRPAPDRELVDIADYVDGYHVADRNALDAARSCTTDTLACALDALSHPECTKLLGPVVPGTIVPLGSRVPGTHLELDPVTATFSFGCMIRWLDFNDTFTAAQGSHPSDNLAGILMLADHLSRRRADVMPVLTAKLEASLARRFPPVRITRILQLIDDAHSFEHAPVHEFLDLLAV